MRKILVFLMLCAVSTSWAQRQVININRSWEFIPGWEVRRDVSTVVNLPHTWNLDALSGKWDYERGLCNYVKMIDIPAAWKDKKVFIRFKGANQTADLYVNSKHVGEHRGGYTAFCWDITPYLNAGAKNAIWVRLTNALDLNIMPLLGDFNMYGGIYRDVELIVVPSTHISPEDYASSGVYVTTSNVTDQSAEVGVRTVINASSNELTEVTFAIYDMMNREIARESKRVKFDQSGVTEVGTIFTIDEPHLWNATEDPYLYRAAVTVRRLIDVVKPAANANVAKDSVSQNFGLRYWSIDKDNQFYLNGLPLRIKGVGRHQDYAMQGNALFPENHERDIEWLREIGANAVRLTHYPQDPYFIELCDRAGIMVWSEIPFIGPGGYRDKGFNDAQDFMENGRTQLIEMIRQLYNHPSILWWGLFNELTQRGDDPKGYVRSLNNLAKEEDESRPTVAASNQDGDLNFITDQVGFNQYLGWYGGEPGDIKQWAVRLRKDWPRLKVGLSEYGAGASIYQHADSLLKPVANSYWHPEQWQTHFHEVYWRNIASGNYFWGTFVWCMFDFGAAHRTEGLRPGVNDKGLVTFDRRVAKDAFYFYKANWNEDDRFVYISERRWQNRPQLKQTFKIFSNCDAVELIVNGVSQGVVSNDGFGTFVWKDIAVVAGNNNIEASSTGLSENDRCTITVTPDYSKM